MQKPLKYIIVGTGGFGEQWCKVFLPHLAAMGKAVPAAAVDASPEALKNAQRYLGVPTDKCYASMEAAFDANPADFAIVVVPPALHEKVVDLALAHHMNILSEKPIADSMEACVRIYRKVQAAGAKMAVTMSHRFDQDKQTLEQCIKSGEYGRLNYIMGRITHNCRKYGTEGKFRHEMADPLLVDAGVHHFEIFRALSGANAKTVYTLAWNPPWGEYGGDSTGLVTFEMTNGVKCFYEGAKANASTLNGWTNEYFRAECEFGTLMLSQHWLKVLKGSAWERPLSMDIPLLQREVWMNSWLAEMYCDWLLGERDSHPTNVEDNLQCVAMVFGAIESAHTGQVVNVQEFLQRYLKA